MNAFYIRSAVGLCTVLAAISFQAATAGPISPYYLTAGDQGKNWVVQGTAVINGWAQHNPEKNGEYAIAIPDTVRTLGNGNQADHHSGSEYTLAGVYTGTDYAYPDRYASFYDGTSDGRFNYTVSYGPEVYRMNTDWTNPVLLFTITESGSRDFFGITYDPTNSSLWVSRYAVGIVENRSLSGELLSSFRTPFDLITALAYDHADNTLWMGSASTPGRFYQYSKAGVQLDTVFYSALASQDTLGGEILFTPEPSSIALLFVGVAVIGLYHNKRVELALNVLADPLEHQLQDVGR